MTDPRLSETSAAEFADALRAGYRAIILEADEWRPLGEHVKALVALARKERDEDIRRVVLEVRSILDPDEPVDAWGAIDEVWRRLFPGEKP